LHATAGHLAIFVGTKVAAKEHSEFINYMDLIDGMPPGLYEIVISDKSEGEVGSELLTGDFNVRIEERSLDDIRALGCNSMDDEREFETVARLSALNNALYSAFAQPRLKEMVTPQSASAVLEMQPLRLKYAMFSDKNPLMHLVPPLSEKARAERVHPDPDNPCVKAQEAVSKMVEQWLETLGRIRDQTTEAVFHAVYGSPALQACLGVIPNGRPRPKPGVSPNQRAAVAARIDHLRSAMEQGGPLEGIVRALVYIAKGQKSVDARSFEVLRRALEEHPNITLAHYKTVVREQWAMLTIDETAAIKALPKLLPSDAAERRAMFEKIRDIRTAAGELEGEAKRRMACVQELFEIKSAPTPARRKTANGASPMKAKSRATRPGRVSKNNRQTRPVAQKI
jgi:hypothetical protein